MRKYDLLGGDYDGDNIMGYCKADVENTILLYERLKHTRTLRYKIKVFIHKIIWKIRTFFGGKIND